MPAKIIDGEAIAASIRAEIASEIATHRKRVGGTFRGFPISPSPLSTPPCLAVVLCSNDPASQIYVERKQQACKDVGIASFLIRPFEGAADIGDWYKPIDHLLAVIDFLNHDESVHGILVQLPLPGPLDAHAVFDRIDPLKDVDVFSPTNVGLLLQGRPRYVPCTPYAIQEMLAASRIETDGKRVTIINRSDIVGKPLHALLSQNKVHANATVTLCHDHTPPQRLKEICLNSDIIVVAVGKPKFLTADLVPEGATVIDVGINRVEGSRKIVGDVDFAPVAERAEWISRVPGGVGPVVVSCLLRNTVLAQKLHFNIPA